MSQTPRAVARTFARVHGSMCTRALASFTALALSAALAAGESTMPLADPALGMVEGQLPILPGWTGTAVIDRVSDPVGGGTAQWSVDLQSPDRSRGIRILPVAFHTFSPLMQQYGATAPPQASAYLVFRSTAELLTQQILPRLEIAGDPSAPFPIDREKLAAALAKQSSNGLPNPFFDTAAVIVRNALPGQEILVEAVTVGFARGMPNEMSSTQIQLFRAPIGQARALHDEIARLPELQPDPNWLRADRQLADRKLAEIAQQGQRARAQMDQQLANTHATIQANSNAQFDAGQQRAAAQRAQYDQQNAAWARRQQSNSDSNALFIGHIGDHSVTYKWCNGSTGAVRFVTDNLQSPGSGYQRC